MWWHYKHIVFRNTTLRGVSPKERVSLGSRSICGITQLMSWNAISLISLSLINPISRYQQAETLPPSIALRTLYSRAYSLYPLSAERSSSKPAASDPIKCLYSNTQQGAYINSSALFFSGIYERLALYCLSLLHRRNAARHCRR